MEVAAIAFLKLVLNTFMKPNATLSGKKLLAKISKERAKANYFLSILERLVRLCFWDNKANTSFAPLPPNLLALLI